MKMKRVFIALILTLTLLITPALGKIMPMPKLDKQDYRQLLADMPEYLQIWRSNVKDGALYTYNLKNPDMQMYFSYN